MAKTRLASSPDLTYKLLLVQPMVNTHVYGVGWFTTSPGCLEVAWAIIGLHSFHLQICSRPQVIMNDETRMIYMTVTQVKTAAQVNHLSL